MSGRTVHEVMTRTVTCVNTGTPFKEVARVLAERRISAVPVLDEQDRLIGVVSEADLMAKIQYQDTAISGPRPGLRERRGRAKASGETAGELMSSPPVTVAPDTTVAEAARLMDREQVKRLPVVDADNRVVGVFSRADVLKLFLRSDTVIRNEIIREVFLRALWAEPTGFDVEVSDGMVTLTGQLQRRSEVPIAEQLARQIDGVIGVVNQLGFAVDDVRRPPVRPESQRISSQTPR
jgi:CBS-domain-containing membrane protein